jgi:hypothetical protein
MKRVPFIFLLTLVVVLSLQTHGFPQESLTSLTDAGPDPDFSPHGPYTGPLVLPHIVRFRELPMRMDLEPLILPPNNIKILDERMIPLFERVLREASDLEVQEEAALSLARVALEKAADISSCEATLREILKSAKSDRIRNACGFALTAGNMSAAGSDLVPLAAKGADPQRLLLEPSLAKWKTASAVELWRPRLSDPFVSTNSFRLAAEGLAALNDASSLGALQKIFADSTVVFAKRRAAAGAIAQLDPDQAFASAEALIAGTVPDRLLAIALLDNTKVDSPERTAQLCNDPTDAVASAAWHQIFRRHPETLVNHLATGRSHRDAEVRMTAARVIRLFPTDERAGWLQLQLSDVHIEVRNVARQMLAIIAEEHADLKEQIVRRAGEMLNPESQDWQGIEQSLILLGQLKATEFSPQCVSLIDYPRHEVGVSATWLIQMFPDDSIRDAMLTRIEATEKLISVPGENVYEAAIKLGFLLQYAGLVRLREVQPILETKFSKSSPGGAMVRCSALWALGIFFEKKPEPQLVAKLEERIKDRINIPPEWESVRRTSILALGLLRSKTSVSVVEDAYKIDPPNSLIPGTARWVMPLLGEPMLPPVPPILNQVGGWRLNPVEVP